MKISGIVLNRFALVMVLLYPIMVVGYVPFGGGIRYYSVLLPVAMLLMFISARLDDRFAGMVFSKDVLVFAMPFLPFMVALLLVSIVHDHFVFFVGVSKGVLYAALLYALLKYAGLEKKKIILVPAIACFVFLLVALWEVGIQGRGRAWGLVYENTFGQFSVFCAGVSLLAAIEGKATNRWRLFMLSAVLAGSSAAVLSGSRGALLPMVGLFTALLFTVRRARLAIAFFCLVAIVAAYFDVLGFYSRILLSFSEVKSYFLSGHVNESSVGIRLELWRIALFSLLNSDGVGFGAVPFKVLASSFAGISSGAAYMDHYFGHGGVVDPWKFHGDIPQIMAFGGWVLLLGFALSVVFLFRFSRVNVYASWVAWCGIVWGLSELFVFNRVSFGLVLVNLALFCSLQSSGNMLKKSLP